MLIITPHSARGTRTPSPMNDSPAASRIAQPHWRVETTMIGTSVFGSRCRQSRRRRVLPTEIAARAYSLSFALNIRFLISRAAGNVDRGRGDDHGEDAGPHRPGDGHREDEARER